MPDVLHNDSDEAVLDAIDRNWRVSVGAFGLAPTTVVRDDDELFWYVTGLPTGAFNSIMYANLPTPARIDAAVEELHTLRRRHGVEIGWVIGPASRPADLGQQLQARGLRYMRDITPMTMTLDDLPAAAPVAGLTIERIADPAAYEAWIDAEQRGFEAAANDETGLVAVRRAMGIRHGLPLHHFLGRLDGTPIATATVLLAAGIGGIYDVSTAPEARRCGIGMAMTLAALQEARRLGYEVAFLQPSEMGRPLYERIGFRQRCACPIYL